MNQAGYDLLKHYEGFRPIAYLDPVGVPTIGYGFTQGVSLGDTITPDDAAKRLKDEVEKFEAGVRTAILLPANENQLAGMTCLAYNIGLGNFEKSTVLREHNRGDWALAAAAFRMWSKAGGVVLPGLVMRRNSEARLYLTLA